MTDTTTAETVDPAEGWEQRRCAAPSMSEPEGPCEQVVYGPYERHCGDHASERQYTIEVHQVRGELIDALDDALTLAYMAGAHADRLDELDVDWSLGGSGRDVHAALQQARIGIRAARGQVPAVQDLPEWMREPTTVA